MFRKPVSAKLRRSPLWKKARALRKAAELRRELARLARHRPKAARLNILVINHFFDGEIEALEKTLAEFPGMSLFAITPEPFFSQAIYLFPDELAAANIPYDAPELAAQRTQYRAHCERLFDRLHRSYPFDCVLTPSDCFYWLREFIAAARARGVPTLVADKEGTITGRSFLTEPLRIRQMMPPVADRFLVWSERQAEFWRQAGVREDMIFISGSSRSDSFVNLERSPDPSMVLVYDFDVDAYISNLDWQNMDYLGPRDWIQLRDAIHRNILHSAKANPQVKFVVKCHPQQVVTRFAQGAALPPNLRLIAGPPKNIPKLLADARVVVGFQTTALLEAALAGIPVLYAAWGDLYLAAKDQILPWHESGFGIQWCRTPEELGKNLQVLINDSPQASAQSDRSRLPLFFHQADGNATRRLLREISQFVESG